MTQLRAEPYSRKQAAPSVRHRPPQFVVAWSSYEQDDTEAWGVFGQRFDFDAGAVVAENPSR